MRGKLIDNYKKWKKRKVIPRAGLCNVLKDTVYAETLELFSPSMRELKTLAKVDECTPYWGAGISMFDYGVSNRFTPRREAIILLICAMHNEL